MKKIPSIIALLLVTSFLKAQDVEKLITEDYVRKVVSTLASDEMKGRSARNPENAMKAADFIASQFQEIGLEQLNGVSDFKQGFTARKSPGIQMANVVGVLKGKSKPDEIVVFSGHYDHKTRCRRFNCQRCR